MSKSKKIFFIILAFIYLAHVYSRLVHTPPIYLYVSSKSAKSEIECNSDKKLKSFILHRRHLPLIKKIEVGKLYPTILSEKFFLIRSQNILTITSLTNIEYTPNELLVLSNKAPPQIVAS